MNGGSDVQMSKIPEVEMSNTPEVRSIGFPEDSTGNVGFSVS